MNQPVPSPWTRPGCQLTEHGPFTRPCVVLQCHEGLGILDTTMTDASHGPLCFVIMPFGTKPRRDGVEVDFDQVYEQLLQPAVRKAGLRPIRGDQELVSGLILKPMFERLVMCDYAVADLSAMNDNVFYELGVRHGTKPRTTVAVTSDAKRLPFDIQDFRVVEYEMGADGRLASVGATIDQVASALVHAREDLEHRHDSPVYQILGEGLQPPDISRLKTDTFREKATYAQDIKDQLGLARELEGKDKLAAIAEIQERLGTRLGEVEVGVLVDLFLAYRDARAYRHMIDLYGQMPAHVQRTCMVMEQYAFALNCEKRWREAQRVLDNVIERFGKSGENLGLLGRVYKDRWEDELVRGRKERAIGFLKQAVETYVEGFEADWRDAYPGINALTLMELCDPPDERFATYLPLVHFAVEQRQKHKTPDYWDHAASMELAILTHDEPGARDALEKALRCLDHGWMANSTLKQIRRIGAARARRGQPMAWLGDIEAALERHIGD